MLLRFRARLRSNVSSPYFVRGCAVHAGLAAHYDAKTNDEAIEVALNELAIRAGACNLLPEQTEIATEEVVKTMQFYLSGEPGSGVWQDMHDSVQTIAVENVFNIQLAEGVELVGIIDHIKHFHRGAGMNGRCVEDHKTSKKGGTSYGTNIEYDPQQILYSWAAREMGYTPDWFSWNVIVLTKQPYVMRLYEPIFWPRITEYVSRAIGFAEWMRDQTDDPVQILLNTPGNPGQCRNCTFRALCDNPMRQHNILAQDFKQEAYDSFTNYRRSTP